MKDIKELIFAAVEENAVKFQELVNAQLQTRAYDAIEALRPEVGASMFGEEVDEMDEALVGKQHKIDKNKNGKIDAHDFKLLRKEEVEELDELSKGTLKSYVKKADRDMEKHSDAIFNPRNKVYRDAEAGKKGAEEKYDHHDRKYHNRIDGIEKANARLNKEEVENLEEGPFKGVGKMLMKHKLKSGIKKDDKKVDSAFDKMQDHEFSDPKRFDHEGDFTRSLKNKSRKEKALGRLTREEVEELDEISAETLQSYRVKAKAQSNKDAHELRANVLTPKSERKYKGREAFNMMKRVHKRIKGVDKASEKLGKTRYDEEVEQVDEVAMPQNQADWQALITHQIKTTGHPVATDAQFRAPHGKDESKIASLEPGQDKAHYAAAQGGNVKP